MARSMHEGRRIPAHPDDVREGLREAAERYGDAEQARALALADTAAWLVAAYELETGGDLTMSEAIGLSAVSRPTAYRLLREQGVELDH